MRHFVAAAFFLNLNPSSAIADARVSFAELTGEELVSTAAVPQVRKSDARREIARTAQNSELEWEGPPAVKIGPLTPPAANDFDFVCVTLETAARRNDLPVSYLTRLIWQESRFNAYAVSPAGAQGVAQFMPGTAAWLGLTNPFDVSEAINKSAEFLRELRKQFGNIGLASAAYNAGPKRVQDWLAGDGGLPRETLAYVSIITGHAVEEWRSAQSSQWDLMLPEAVPCTQLVKHLADKPERISSRDTPALGPVSDPAQGPWGLQLIGDRSQASALAGYHQLQRKFKTVLAGLEPLVLRSRVGRKGYWYRVRVAAQTLFQAERLCSSLRAAGGICLVQRN